MAAKFKLPRHIEMRDAIYTLVYVPGDDNYIEPNFSAMQPAAADCTLVTMGRDQKWMSWVMMDAPARNGSATPPRKFLLFRLYDQPIQPIPAMFTDMIVYMCAPVEQGSSPAQAFLNALLGKHEEESAKRVPHDDWAKKMFVVPDEDDGTDSSGPANAAMAETPAPATSVAPEVEQ